MIERLGRSAGFVVVGIATAILIMAVSIVPFVTPAWVSIEQGRAEAAAWTGYTPAQLSAATDAILSDLVLGPPEFDVEIDGRPVLTERERGHMGDVRGVFVGLAVLAVASVVVLLVSYRTSRGGRSFWQPVRAGAAGLAVAVVAIGLVGAFAFDLAFEIFHRLFFAGGTYTFDPRTDRLVQLFPEKFWFETSMAVGVVILGLCAATWWAGRARLARGAAAVPVVGGRLEASR